jgi:two-component system, LytTR family, sensor kinase
MPHETKVLLPEQFLLVTLMVKLAVVAVLSTMLVRFPWFRRILLTEKRDWPERLVFAASLGVPLTAGVLARLLLNYEAADLTLSGSFLVGLLAGPYSGAIVGAMVGIPAMVAGEWIALPFAIGCGFAGGGLRELCPKEAIWHFSPLFFTDLHRYVWRLVRRLQIDWVVLMLAAPISLELLRQYLGRRFGYIFFHNPPAHWLLALVVFATVLGVAIPIKIWNSARIEHRLQEQEKLLLAARVAALASQINPHFLFNTLTSISSLIRSQPETARTLIVKLSGLLRRLLRSQEHFVTLREELEAIDEYLDIEAVRFGPKLTIEKSIDPGSLDVMLPSMLLQPLVENSIKHGLSPKIGEGRILIRTSRQDGHSIIDIIDNGVGIRHADNGTISHAEAGSDITNAASADGITRGPVTRERLMPGSGIGLKNVNERLRVIYGANYQLQLDSVPGGGTCARIVIPELVVPARIPA